MRYAALAVALVVCSSCLQEDRGTRPVPQQSATEQPITKSSPLVIRNEASGADHRRVNRAVADLRRLRLWKRLTRGLDIVKVGSRDWIPPDRHLGDSLVTAVIEDGRSLTLCDVLLYSAAIDRDLRRWARFWSQRRIDSPPPSLDRYWTRLLGHELAHCLPNDRGERKAARWEQRVRRAYERLGASES